MNLLISKNQADNSYNKILNKSRIDFGFIIMVGIALTICTLGFAINSVSVIIGSMLVSPLLYPLLSIPATLFWKDYKYLRRKSIWIVITVISSIIFAIFLSSLLEYFSLNNYGSELIERLGANLLIYFLIAIASGAGGAISLFRPHVLEAIPGVAISVAAMPPIVMVGYSITIENYPMLWTSSQILLINFIGIMIGSAIIVYIFKKIK